tara:strand:- start:532 stop:2379 length:1848 start_codon:yes stop_codon:yes gene_type:complete
MALENGGLDAQIEQRMDAYRGNPQQLQQRYGQNKELLDLLALQKLTSEKQAASRDMQMKMQQQPGTIAQQREQEALELTKQEMGSTLGDLAGRTKSTLDQKQMTQQQNMGKMAQAASRPPQGGIGALMGGAAQPQARPPMGNPQTQGLAGARMAQAQQRPPVRMAQGGIVSFAQGQGVSGQSGLNAESLEQKIARIKARPELSAGQKQALIKQILAQEPKPQVEPNQRMTPIGRESSARMPGQDGLIPVGSGTSALDVMAELNPAIAPERPSPVSAPTTAAPPPAPVDTAPATGGITDLLDQQGQTPTRTVPTAGETAASFTAPQTAGAANTGVMGAQGTTNADSAFLKGTRMADEYTGRAAASESYEGMKSRLSEFDEANYGPNDDLNAFLIGMGGTGSIGSAMKGGYNAMNRSKNNRRNRLMDEFQLEKDRIGADAVFSTAGIRLGTQLAADAAANERSIRQAAATMGAAKIRAVTADADRLAKTYAAQLKAASDAATLAAEKAENKTALALDVAELTAKTRDNLVTAVVKDDSILQGFNMQARAAIDDPEALAVIEGNMNERMDYLSFVVDSAMNDYGLLESEENAANELTRALRLPTLTEDDVAGVEVDGE